MANPTEDIYINDFRAGIVGDHFASLLIGANAQHTVPQDGAAQYLNTYSCYADPISGALCPLPARNQGQSQAIPFTAGTSHQPANRTGFFVLDAAVVSSIKTGTATPYTDQQIHVLLGFWWDPTASGTYRWYVIHRVWTYNQTTATWSTKDVYMLKAAATPGAPPYEVGGGQFVKARALPTPFGGGTPAPVASSLQPMIYALAECAPGNTVWGTGPATIDATEAAVTTYETDYTIAGPPHALPGLGATATPLRATAWGFPDPNNPTSFSNIGLPLSGYGTQIVGHQGRIVQLNHRLQNFGDGTIAAFHETFEYTPVNWPAGIATEAFAGEENPAGFGAAASMTTNQLLLVKHSGGGVLVSGGLDRFQVTRLPFLEPTYGLTYRAVNTPIGVVYASRTGIYAYAGGPTATKLSDNREGFFFDHLTSTHANMNKGSRGSLGYFHPFVVAPDGNLYDTRTKAWWQLTDRTRRYNCYDVNTLTGELCAFSYNIHAGDTTVYDYFLWQTLASSYSWQSQPLLRTRENLYTAQEVEIVAIPSLTGSSDTITLTLNAHNTDPASVVGGVSVATATVTFDVSTSTNGRIIIARKDIAPNVSGRYMTLRIQASSATGPAPKILSVRIRGREGTSIAKN